MGPISLSFSDDFDGTKITQPELLEDAEDESNESENGYGKRISSMTTTEWRQKFEQNGTVDLFLEEEFNAGSRLVVSHTLQKSHFFKITFLKNTY